MQWLLDLIDYPFRIVILILIVLQTYQITKTKQRMKRLEIISAQIKSFINDLATIRIAMKALVEDVDKILKLQIEMIDTRLARIEDNQKLVIESMVEQNHKTK